MNKNTLEQLVKFMSETGMLARCTRKGPTIAGVTEPEFLSGHIARTAQIAYVLAYLENLNPEKVACIALFHDNGEIRVNDQTKIGSRYYDAHSVEKAALTEQVSFLPDNLAHTINKYFAEFEQRDTKEGIVAKDADWLATALFAKEMVERGYKGMQKWIDNVEKALETDSAKEILAYIMNMDDFTNYWWQGLKKMTYKKLTK
jgi:5'-deoxynucleotidase YfbR-like HD superfamily hydrolase